MFIDGLKRQRRDGACIRSPYTGHEVGCVAIATPGDVDDAVTSVSSYKGHLAADERAGILERAAAALSSRRDEFARRITDEAGICVSESVKEVNRSCQNLRVAAAETLRLRGETIPVSINGCPRM